MTRAESIAPRGRRPSGAMDEARVMSVQFYYSRAVSAAMALLYNIEMNKHKIEVYN